MLKTKLIGLAVRVAVKGLCLLFGFSSLSVPIAKADVDYQPTTIQPLYSHSLFNEKFNIDESLLIKYILFKEILTENHLPVYVYRRFVAIAKAESSLRHHDSKGKVLRGEANRNDIGVMQINEKIWGDRAKKEGLDIYDLEDNIKMAVNVIYKERGFTPWNWSKTNQDKFLK